MSVTCDRSVVFSIDVYIIFYKYVNRNRTLKSPQSYMNEMNNCIVQDVLRYIIQQCKRHWQKWFSSCTPVSSTNKTDCHDITEMLLKAALYTINLNHRQKFFMHIYLFYNSSSWHIFCDIVTRVSVISFESFVIIFF